MEITGIVFAALIGLAVGSFLNVCIDRLPAGKSLVHPPSFCDSCETPLSRKDMVPVLSYLLLRGRCRVCGAKIPLRVLLVEAAGGLIFALDYWQFGFGPQFAVFTFYFLVLLLVFVIDLEQHLILNKVVYPVAVIALAVDVVMPRWGVVGIAQPGVLGLNLPAALGGLPSGLIGAAIPFAIFFVIVMLYPAGMGMGDAKFVGLMGLMTGLANVFVGLMIGIVMGGLMATALIVLRMKKRKDVLPFGTFLTVGTAISLLWGTGILHWYLSFFAH